jgi:DNA-directed RNA polymerase specialized sigma24 family protein
MCTLDDEDMVQELLCSLRLHARHLVGVARIESWQGQKEDLVEDIVQETVLRILERIQRATAGTLPPINSLKGFMKTVAYHYCIDLQRHDARLRRITPESAGNEYAFEPGEQTDLLALVTEHLSQEELFGYLAHHIAHFPRKQREALLIDLAKYTHSEEPSPLQQALLAQGIDLQIYQRPLPADPDARTRHSSLLSIAYKRVARCICHDVEE